jgi:sortase (surface protein transpeptidase)
VRIEIPEVGLRAPIVPVGLDGHHALQVPHDWGTAGWWKDGARPGERGPAVIVGHVDSTTGPAVFYRVPGLRRGSRIRIVRRDGSVIHFTVTGIAQYAKTRFPTARVYGATRRPTLRLITCSGTFDRSTGHYLDNTIVVAVHR